MRILLNLLPIAYENGAIPFRTQQLPRPLATNYNAHILKRAKLFLQTFLHEIISDGNVYMRSRRQSVQREKGCGARDDLCPCEPVA